MSQGVVTYGVGMEAMSRDVLLVTTMAGAASCAVAMAELLHCEVEVAGSRRAGLLALRRREFGAVLVEETLAEGDPDWADQMWSGTGLAMPMRVNFAISGASRLAREVSNALMRREGEQARARRVVTEELENELKGTVTGLLLQTELALREPAGSQSLEPKLRNLVELAGEIRAKLRGAGIDGEVGSVKVR